MEAASILLIRHAESVWNAQARWQGQSDPPLSERGRAQAEAAGRRLAGRGIRALYSSDLARAVQTARALGRALALEPRLDPRLREFDVGEWSGLGRAEIARRWPEDLARLRARDPDVRPGGGESPREVAARAIAALDEIARRNAGTCVAVVTHMGVIRRFDPAADLGPVEMLSLRRTRGRWLPDPRSPR